MKVKRYNAGCAHAGEEEMVQVGDGAYVSHEDYAALLKERDELAVECKTLSRFISGSCYVFDGDHDDDMPDEFIDASHYMPIVTPATDAFLAEVRASELDSLAGVAETMLVKFSNQRCSSDMHEVVGWKMVLQQASNRATQLRKESNHD